MAKAEGMTLPFKDPTHINASVLETFEYDGVRQRVTYETEEFTAVCPFSGLPDIGVFLVEYVPSSKCVELKSLKYYLLSYRDVGIYQEHAASRLYKDLWKILEPEELEVTLIYKTRGGIDTTCVVSSLEQ
jgi:7-cyano-7-deazaguanine reductase